MSAPAPTLTDRRAADEDLLPDQCPVRLLDEHGDVAASRYPLPEPALARDMYRRLVVSRALDRQATLLARQGRLAVYPASHGQEACQVGAVLALRDTDWLFPTYRDSVAVINRGVDPVEVLTLLRGDWHCGYDPRAWRTAPMCTPLATQTPHAAGLAHAAALAGDDVVALAIVGDGGTSEGDFHEACNVAAVTRKQTAAPTLAHKAIGYGMVGRRVDGNDVFAVHAVVREAVEAARAGRGPALIEAITYRMDPHTNSDDPRRYRDDAEVAYWRSRDPIARVERYLSGNRLLDNGFAAEVSAAARAQAAALRDRVTAGARIDPLDLFADVYAAPTTQLQEQATRLAAEIEAEGDA
ncbi:MAG: pyruvate dehydrogenase (acetyl-transferring) E1 component subunit alpha [Actinobacteria bacterium 13_1_20CM_3_71_11]|nr:MAG: pyruvate dehydrogenase (acetyl-transferring) E1 component subunit alpha [Actinobacteria bacterium 13_1_20CM_3_71_11]